MRALKRLVLALLLVVVALSVLVLYNGWRVGSARAAAAPIAPRTVDVGRVAAILAGAIRIPTISATPAGPSAESLAALEEHLRASFPRLMALPIERPAGGTLLITWQGSDPALPPVVLMAHQDVVPVVPGTEGEWQQPPFAGAVDGEFVWGRGAMDDKGSLISISMAAEALLEAGFSPKRTVLFAFGHDEEVLGSGAKAAAELLAARGVRPALVLDEGLMILRDAIPGVAAPVALVGVAEKGYASFELLAEAEGGHSSVPHRESAISILAAALERLTRTPLAARGDSPVFGMLDPAAPHAAFGMRLVLANRWLFGPLLERQLAKEPLGDALLRTTLAPTIVEGGVKENVVPPRARAVVNLRLLPGDTVTAMERELVRRIADSRVALQVLGPPSEASPVSAEGGWGYAALDRALRDVRPDVVVAPGLMVGGTDARHFAAVSDQVFRFFPVEIGKEDTARFHGRNERISKQNLEQAVRVYARLLEISAG